MFADRKWALVVLIAVPVLADLVGNLAAPASFWSEFLPNLYYAAMIVAGLRYGWRSGLGFALLAGVCHAAIAGFIAPASKIRLEASVLAFLVVGFAFFEQRRRSVETARGKKTSLESGQGDTKESVEQVAAIATELLREVRTPFASIEGAAYILEENAQDLENRKEFIEIIRCECRRIGRVLSEIEQCTEAIPLKRAAVDAATLLSEVVRVSALEHPDPAISLRIEVAPDLPKLWCDSTRVKQVLVPFVSTAMDGMTGGGELLLAASREADLARIELRVLGQVVHGTDPLVGRGQYSSTFDASSGVRVLAARRTMLQHGGTITVEQTGHVKKLSSLTLPLYNGQTP